MSSVCIFTCPAWRLMFGVQQEDCSTNAVPGQRNCGRRSSSWTSWCWLTNYWNLQLNHVWTLLDAFVVTPAAPSKASVVLSDVQQTTFLTSSAIFRTSTSIFLHPSTRFLLSTSSPDLFLFQVFFGRPLPLWPCGHPWSACLAMCVQAKSIFFIISGSTLAPVPSFFLHIYSWWWYNHTCYLVTIALAGVLVRCSTLT